MMNAVSEVGLSKRVHDLVTGYVLHKTEAKSGIAWKEYNASKSEKYREAREKVCADAFLRLRSCRSRDDFVSFFTGTICSVPQFLPLEEYERFSLALLDEVKWEDVKALAMLTLSSLYLSKKKEEEK